MVEEFDKVHNKALKSLNSMIDGLENDRWFYEGDIEYEYTSFEEEIKSYCDSYAEFYISNNKTEKFFDSIKKVVEAIVECDADMYDEDFFRPIELITYYLGKIISSDSNLKEDVHDWLEDFCDENEGDIFVEDYFKPFLKGDKIFHADNYYTGYNDYNKMIGVFK